MPLPSLVFLTFATGVAAALASRAELRVSPRPSLVTRGFAAYAIFLGMLVVPIAVYFYIFHGDWFLLYAVDVGRIPSALALIGFLLVAALGAAGFGTGAALVRIQRDVAAGMVAVGTLALAGVVSLVARDRLSVVGSYAQFHGRFGLEPYGRGPVMIGTLVMGGLFIAGLSYLLARLYRGVRA